MGGDHAMRVGGLKVSKVCATVGNCSSLVGK